MSTSESRVSTQTYLLPGQQLCIGLPWERQQLLQPQPKKPLPAASQNPFDKAELLADPCAGLEIGPCQVIRKLSDSSANIMLAMRNDRREGSALVALRKLELNDAGMQDLLEHARFCGHFRHPNLSRVYEPEASDEGIFWITEFASGATLQEISAACRKIGKAVPVGLALSTAYETALALAELHVPGNHAHGSISAETVLVAFDGHSKLLDLGLMRCIAGKVLRPEGLKAMAPYLSPEQVKQGRMPDPKTDVYSLAAVLHECLSGQKLPNGFEREPHFVPPSSFNIALGKELDAVVMRALDPDRSKRFRAADELARALKAAASAFMWRPELRADFVSQLFQTRKRREEVLLAGCEEILPPPTRVPTMPKMPKVEPPPPPKATKEMRAPKAAAAPATTKKPARRKKKTNARALVLALVAAALALVWERGLVNLFPKRHVPLAANAARSADLIPPPPPTGVDEERVLESMRATYLPKPKLAVAAAPKKKKKDEATALPPWLQPKGNRR